MTLTDKFMKELHGATRNNKVPFIYWNLFSILYICDKEFMWLLSELYSENSDPNYWFYRFHKLIRQTDVFEGFKHYIKPSLSKEERKLRFELREDIRELRKNDLKGTPEYYDKIRELTKIEYAVKERWDGEIDGHLDSILWEVISRDQDTKLQDFMQSFLNKHV